MKVTDILYEYEFSLANFDHKVTEYEILEIKPRIDGDVTYKLRRPGYNRCVYFRESNLCVVSSRSSSKFIVMPEKDFQKAVAILEHYLERRLEIAKLTYERTVEKLDEFRGKYGTLISAEGGGSDE